MSSQTLAPALAFTHTAEMKWQTGALYASLKLKNKNKKVLNILHSYMLTQATKNLNVHKRMTIIALGKELGDGNQDTKETLFTATLSIILHFKNTVHTVLK